MATPIRPFHPPTVAPNQTPVRSNAAREAQRAFFQQALGNAAPAQAAQAPAATQVAAPVRASTSRAVEPHVTRVRTQPIPDEKPIGYRRPGSFVDIKV
jgi:CO/xanthine dehydrogenase Mo-binding subunit